MSVILAILGGGIIGYCLPSITSGRYWLGMIGLILAIISQHV